MAFSGEIGSGKTTLSYALATRLNWKHASFGELLRAEAIKRGIINPSRRELQNLGQTWINKDIKGFGLALLRSVDWSPGEPLVIDGVRHLEMISVLKELTLTDQVRIVFTYTTTAIRKKRQLSRGGCEINDIDESHPVEIQSHSILAKASDLLIDTTLSVCDCVNIIVNWLEDSDSYEYIDKCNGEE